MHQAFRRHIIDPETADTRNASPGFRLGVVMLATRFPRLPGDIGNPESFPFPVVYRRVSSARVTAVIRDAGPPAAVADAIVTAAQELDAEGVGLIATSCGFLGGLQTRLQVACRAPVLASSLVLLPWLRSLYGGTAPIGVLTFDSRELSPRHLGAGSDGPLVVEGLETGTELFPVISEDRPDLDAQRAEVDAVAAANRLVARAPGLAAILLECTNLSPYRHRLIQATGLPVFDINTAISMAADAHGAISVSLRG